MDCLSPKRPGGEATGTSFRVSTRTKWRLWTSRETAAHRRSPGSAIRAGLAPRLEATHRFHGGPQAPSAGSERVRGRGRPFRLGRGLVQRHGGGWGGEGLCGELRVRPVRRREASTRETDPRRPRRRREHGGRRSPLSERDGDHAGRPHPDRGREQGAPAHGLRHRTRREGSRAGGSSPISRRTSPTASASTPRVPCGPPIPCAMS